MKKLSFYLAIILVMALSSCFKKSETKSLYPRFSEDPNSHSIFGQLVRLKSGFIVERKDSLYYLGDIVLSSAQLNALDEYGTFFPKCPSYIGPDTSVHPVYNIPMQMVQKNLAIPRAFSQYPTPYNMWAMVRFTYNPNLPFWLKEEIRSVLYQMQAVSNVRFYNATGQPTIDPIYGFPYPYIDFYYIGAASTSNSRVGRVGGMQRINLANFVIYQPNAIVHEICHALGMFHEMERVDRDNYINVNWTNLKPFFALQFQKITSNYYQLGPYDFNSVTGYDSRGYDTTAVNDRVQYAYIKKSDGSDIYQGLELSDFDRRWINTFYIPFIARSDIYAELDSIVYKGDNTRMSLAERLSLQVTLNKGIPDIPPIGRIPNNF